MTSKELNTQYSAFLFCVDYMDGSIEVWPYESITEATNMATEHNTRLESHGYDDACRYFTAIKLPRKRIYKVHEVVKCKA